MDKLHHMAELQTTPIGSLIKEERTNKRNITLLAKKSANLETTLAITRRADHLIMRNIRREIVCVGFFSAPVAKAIKRPHRLR